MIRLIRSGKFLLGMGFGLVLLVACGAAQWQQPPSWTLRSDGRVRASQRGENFSLPEFIAFIKKRENKDYAITIAPSGAQEIANELSRRNAKIIELQNQLRNCR